MAYLAKDLSPEQRLALESLLGRAISGKEAITIRACEPADLSSLSCNESQFSRRRLLTRLHESTKHVVHKGLVSSAVGSKPLEHVMVDADVDMVFGRRYAYDGFRPVGFTTNVVRVSLYRSFQLLTRHGVGFAPVRPVFATLYLGFNLFSRITHGIAFLPHLSLSSP